MTQTLLILLTFLVFASAFAHFRLGTAIGLLLAGAIIGPFGFGLVHDVPVVGWLAELGIVFLLFNLGLEIKLERLRLFGGRVYILAVTQLLFTAIAFGAIAQFAGAGIKAAIVVGGALALSSTAIVLKILADLGRTVTQLGRVAIATLLVQDLAVGPLLILVHAFADEAALDTRLAAFVVGAVVVCGLIVVVVRFALPPIMRAIGALESPELFLVAILFVVLAASWATDQIGMSAAIGAFLAGLMVADSEFRHQIAADIAPFRDVLIGLFFMTVGMRTDAGVLLREPSTVAAITLGIVAIKGLLLVGIARALGYPMRLSSELAVLLAEGSEFSFVVFGIAAGLLLLPASLVDVLTVSVALSMIVVTFAAAAGRDFLDRIEGQALSSLPKLDASTAEFHDHIVITGFGQVGKALMRHLLSLDMPVLVLDYDHRRVREAWLRGLPVFYGNAARSDVLRAAHIHAARLVVVALPDPAMSSRVITLVRRLSSGTRIIARAPEAGEVESLRTAGADAVVIDGLRTAVDLAERTILLFNMAGDEPDEPDHGDRAADVHAGSLPL